MHNYQGKYEREPFILHGALYPNAPYLILLVWLPVFVCNSSSGLSERGSALNFIAENNSRSKEQKRGEFAVFIDIDMIVS